MRGNDGRRDSCAPHVRTLARHRLEGPLRVAKPRLGVGALVSNTLRHDRHHHRVHRELREDVDDLVGRPIEQEDASGEEVLIGVPDAWQSKAGAHAHMKF